MDDKHFIITIREDDDLRFIESASLVSPTVTTLAEHAARFSEADAHTVFADLLNGGGNFVDFFQLTTRMRTKTLGIGRVRQGPGHFAFYPIQEIPLYFP